MYFQVRSNPNRAAFITVYQEITIPNYLLLLDNPPALETGKLPEIAFHILTKK